MSVDTMKTLKNLTLAAVMAFAATSVFAQDMDKKDMDKKDGMRQSNMQGMQNGMMNDGMMMNMEDRDYSAWKDFFRTRVYAPVGAQPMMMKEMMFQDSYDQKAFQYLLRETSAENMRPLRRFDGNAPVLSYDAYWRRLSKMANIYRRELMREQEAQMKMMPMMGMGMKRDMDMARPMDR